MTVRPVQKLTDIDIARYDFLDFGCSKGASLNWASSTFGGKGLGVDIDPDKVRMARDAGCDAVVGDLTKLTMKEDSVKYCIISNLLEHLEGFDQAERVVRESLRVSREFVFITGPNYEKEGWLRENAVKRYHADWSGHTYHHKIADFDQMMKNIGSVQHVIWETELIRDSYSSSLLPLGAAKNSSFYDLEKHGAKPFFQIPDKLHRVLNVCLFKDKCKNKYEVLFKASGMTVRRNTIAH